MVHDVTSKISSLDSRYNVNAVIRPKLGNSCISVREVITTSILYGFDQKNSSFLLSWFKFNNLGLALGTNLKFYTKVAKGLKQKVRKFWDLIPTFAEVTEKKLAAELNFLTIKPIQKQSSGSVL